MIDDIIKKDEGQCVSYVRNAYNNRISEHPENPTNKQKGFLDRKVPDNQELVKRTQQGVRRYDNGLDSGIHCDECWDNMIFKCRQRSW